MLSGLPSVSRRGSINIPPGLQLDNTTPDGLVNFYSDSRTHGYDGPSRTVRIARATAQGGGAISKGEDGVRCLVGGKESLRILRFSDASSQETHSHKFAANEGGHRIEASRNFWDGSGLKVDSAITDVAWGRGVYNQKLLTSARNGEIIMWDLNKSGSSKCERRTRLHMRSIHTLSYSHQLHYYCVTGSADSDLRAWDLRDLSKSILKIRHHAGVRAVVFSPHIRDPLQVIVGLENGSIGRWDLKMGQRGHIDRIPAAHAGPILALDWCAPAPGRRSKFVAAPEDGDGSAGGGGWIASAGMDRTVKVWDVNSGPHMSPSPTYTLHPTFPVRMVQWRPEYECELALVSTAEQAGASAPASAAAARAKSEDGVGAGVGDPVEIWDVRRGWIAKWRVRGSTAEGGVTDVVWGDSHALWAPHSSGAVSQLDVRDATRPLDAIPRAALAWDPAGALAFVVDEREQWEVPYDDIHPDQRAAVVKRRGQLKALGDASFRPETQSIGVFVDEWAAEDTAVLAVLARGYVLQGADKATVCKQNAQIAFDAGRENVGQLWLLAASLLTDVVPAPAAAPCAPPALTHSVSAPAAIPHVHSPRPARTMPLRSMSIDPGKTKGKRSVDSIPSTPAQSSPARGQSALPSPSVSHLSSPSTGQSRSPFLRRDSAVRFPSGFDPSIRRPSLTPSALSGQSISPSGSLKHVGEGALDSDSDEEVESNAASSGAEESGEEESALQPLVSPYLHPRIVPTHPSPLSQIVAETGMDREEDEEDSPSPPSTDTEESVSGEDEMQRPKSNSRTRRPAKSRSRSSTLASLPAHARRRSLVKQESSSSMRTVTAVEGSVHDLRELAAGGGLGREETIRDLRQVHMRQKSEALSVLVLDPYERRDEEESDFEMDARGERQMTERRRRAVVEEETRLREVGWQALRDAVDQLGDEGDVQTCATMAVVIPDELRLGKTRTVRFVEAYIEILARLRLHTSAAHVRKTSQIQEICATTTIHTTVYASCGRCRKPIVKPAAAVTGAPTGAFSYCLKCQQFAKCAICHLPVRALMFQCAVCSHGGHQACYRRYYMERPMIPLVTTFPSALKDGGRAPTAPGLDEDVMPLSVSNSGRLMGHPCAAGCGHFCWATNEDPD